MVERGEETEGQKCSDDNQYRGEKELCMEHRAGSYSKDSIKMSLQRTQGKEATAKE